MSVPKVTVLMDSAGFFAGSFYASHSSMWFRSLICRRKTESTGARQQPSPLPELGVTPRKSLGFRVQGLRFKEQGSSVVQKMPDLCDSRRASPAPNSV